MTTSYTSIDEVSKYVLELAKDGEIKEEHAYDLLKKMHFLQLKEEEKCEQADIAIIGASCMFPDAHDLDEYWSNLISGVNSLKPFPAERLNVMGEISSDFEAEIRASTYKAGYLNDIFRFDPAFFRISPKEAVHMDPVQRLFLQTTYEAAEDAGYGGGRLRDSRTGVFVGIDTTNTSLYRTVLEEDNLLSLTGSLTGIIASRLSYFLNLSGPAVVMDTACSSGLVAVHEACAALRNNNCEMAIVGGVNVFLLPQIDVGASEIESGQGIIRTFDRNSAGTLWGEGLGTIMLKPLRAAKKDNDPIYAVIKGSAINNDGASNGITAPNVKAQIEVITMAWNNAGIHPETISYMETHGTGTLLGDPVEVKGITESFKRFTDKKQFCGIGSVKSNIGHTVAASGIASLLKTILILKHKTVPPTIHFDAPNPLIDFDDSPVYVVNKMERLPQAEHPLRIGVSSFGFSGTNCHMIVEEYVPVQDKPDNEDSRELDAHYLLTISAKNRESLLRTIKRYSKAIQSNKQADLADICYTANTGRGHYAHRLALLFSEREELIDILNALAELTDIRRHTFSTVYYGEHKGTFRSAARTDGGNSGNGDSEQLVRSLTEQANRLVQTLSILPADSAHMNDFELLCELYVQGATVNWEMLYEKQARTRLRLPGYAFDEQRYYPRPQLHPNRQPINGRRLDHPLLHSRLAVSMDQDIYETAFRVADDWVLHEHQIVGVPTVPGVTYLEMAREAGQFYFPNRSIELQDVIFMTPLSVPGDEAKHVQTVINKTRRDCLEFAVMSYDGAESSLDRAWVVHVTGKIAAIPDDDLPGMLDIAKMKHKLQLSHQRQSDPEQPQAVSTAIFDWGPRWDNLSAAYTGEQEVLLEFELPEQYAEDMSACWLHPALLDNAANWVSFHMVEGAYLPLTYKRFQIYGKMPRQFYAYIQTNRNSSENISQPKEVYTIDLLLADADGNIFARIDHYSIKRVHDIDAVIQKQMANRPDPYWELGWTPRSLDKEPLAEKMETVEQDMILLLTDGGHGDEGVEQLRQLRRHALEFEFELAESDQNKADKVGTEQYKQLALMVKQQRITHIWYYCSTDGTGHEEQQSSGAVRLFAFMKELVMENVSHSIHVTIITKQAFRITGTEDELYPGHAMLHGMSQVIVQEHPNLICRCVDIDGSITADQLAVELTDGQRSISVAYRHRERFVPELRHLRLNELKAAPIAIKEEGTYLITGGTGGLGLVTAKYLASKSKVKLALLNRSAFPAREQWNEIIQQQPNGKLAQRIHAIQALEANGSKVAFWSVDVTDEQALSAAVRDIRSCCGPISGVIHAAGVAGEGLLYRKDTKTFKQVLAPKTRGTWLLDRMLAEDELDFFVMFSSTSAFLGGMGQADYAAANRFMDAYAGVRASRGQRTLTINWPAWKETGMAVDYGVNEDNDLFKAISTQEAMEALDQVLQKKITNVIIAYPNFDLHAIQAAERQWFAISPSIKEVIEHEERGGMDADPFTGAVDLTGKSEAYTGFEREVGRIWGHVLGLRAIDVHGDFYDLGGDSIQAIQIVKSIKDVYACDINITDVFDYPSVSELAHVIALRMGVAETSDPVELSEMEQLEKLLDDVESGKVTIDEGVGLYMKRGDES